MNLEEGKIIQALGGLIEYADECTRRRWLYDTLLFVRENNAIDDTTFTAMLHMAEDRSRHGELGQRLEPIRVAARAMWQAKARSQNPTKPHHPVETETIRRFMDGQPTGQGALVKEYLGLKQGAEVWGRLIKVSKVYEFGWGFVVETPAPYAQYEFFVADVWRKGTEHYFDRFLSAWKNDVESMVDELNDTEEIQLTMDDGSCNFDCLSLACYADPETQKRTRAWLGRVFLTELWPVMVTRALDPKYIFEKEWRNK